MPRNLYKSSYTEEFIRKAKEVHGEQYGYDEVVYENSKKPVKIYCKKHDHYFMQTPNAHLRGAGCPLCGREKTIKGKTWTTERFIEAARKVHGDAYDYSKTVYVKTALKVCIICKRCGREFWQTPNSHLAGHGCEACSYVDRGESRSMGQDDFIRRSKEVWGDRFDLSKVEYKNNHHKVCIICREHGPFNITPHSFLVGCSCPKCKSDKSKRLLFGVGINDMYSETGTKCHSVWRNMLARCYGKREQKRHPTYIGCTMCDEWKTYSNFKKWFDENFTKDMDEIGGYEIEKDIIKKSNKVYCPEFCCFVPRRINILLTNRKRFRGNLPVGVTSNESGNKFRASIDKDGASVFLGSFDSAEDAFAAYKKAKEDYIKDVASVYFSKGLITERVRDALFRYEIEITD